MKQAISNFKLLTGESIFMTAYAHAGAEKKEFLHI